MKLEDAPTAGWYPDPERGARLRWWEGTDWSDEWRAPPTAGEMAAIPESDERTIGPRRSIRPEPEEFRVRADDAEQIVTQVREAARQEVTRAASELTLRAQKTFDRYGSIVTGYVRTVWRWARTVIILAAVLVVTWYVLQFIAQAAFLEWIGDRIDDLFAD